MKMVLLFCHFLRQICILKPIKVLKAGFVKHKERKLKMNALSHLKIKIRVIYHLLFCPFTFKHFNDTFPQKRIFRTCNNDMPVTAYAQIRTLVSLCIVVVCYFLPRISVKLMWSRNTPTKDLLASYKIVVDASMLKIWK